MSHVKIVVQALEDIKEGVGVIPNTTKENTTESKDVTVAILERGMVSGKAVVMIALEMPDGNFSIGQISEDNFEMVYRAFKGALQRFEDIKAQQN